MMYRSKKAIIMMAINNYMEERQWNYNYLI